MMLVDMLDIRSVNLELSASKQSAAIRELVGLVTVTGHVSDSVALVGEIEEREEQASTGIGWGVAIPHKLSASVDRAVMAFGRSRRGIAFDAIDGKPVHLFFMIVAPAGSTRGLLKFLSKLSRLLHDPQFRQHLMEVSTPGQVIDALRAKEGEDKS